MKPRGALINTFLTLFIVSAATAIKYSILAIEPAHSFLLYFVAVAASTWLGGRIQGALATALVCAVVVVTSARSHEIDAGVIIRVTFFLIEGLGVTWLIALLGEQREDVRRTAADALASRTVLDNVLETVPLAIVGTEPDGAIFLFNRGAEELTGYHRSEVHGRSLLELFVPDDWKETVSERFRDPNAPSVREPHRNPWRTKSGGERLFEWRCAALPGDSGNRILGVGVDVTEVRRLEEQREHLLAAERDAREAAENANRMKGRFLALLSHELRSPLTAILGWAQLISQTEDAELRALGLRTIEENAKAQARLVDDLLDYARLTARRVDLERKPVQLGALVHSVVDSFVPLANEKRLAIRASIAVGDTVVLGDQDRLRQVFMNILQNAIRYTDSGSVDVRTERENGVVRVVISDTGRGIATEFLPRVFDQFVQEDRASEHDRLGLGLGLGLAVVKEVVTQHGGEVDAHSDGPGKGSSFAVRLPAAV